MNEHLTTKAYQNDEIDLRELWVTLVKRKLTIIAVTTITTITAAFYAWNTVPVYSGEVLIEVGEVVNSNQVINNNQISDETKPTTIFPLDNLHNLKEITSNTTGISVKIPKEATNILRLSMESPEQSEIKSKLENAINSIISRHQEKAKLYQNNGTKIRMTQIVGDISISDEPIKPKKGLIVGIALISGLILGIFLAFFKEFISNNRKSEEG